MAANRSDIASGAIFCLLGLAFGFFAITGLDVGTSWHMGPGYFPFALAIILTLLGVSIIAKGLRTRPDEANPPFPWRAVILIGSAPLIFAFGIKPLGFVPTIAIVAFVASFASRDMTFPKALFTTFFLVVLCVVIFLRVLGLPFDYFGIVFGS